MTRGKYVAAAVAAATLPSCMIRGEPDPGRVPEVNPASPTLADTMVLTAPGGTTVWLTEGRQAVSPQGGNCIERSIEIRRDTSRLKVPLLYTVAVPVLLDDTTMRAELAEQCRSARVYRVNLRTAQPSPMETR